MDSQRKADVTVLGAIVALFGAGNIFMHIDGPQLGLACIGAGFAMMAAGALRGLRSRADRSAS
jgi:hypothetical protein